MRRDQPLPYNDPSRVQLDRAAIEYLRKVHESRPNSQSVMCVFTYYGLRMFQSSTQLLQKGPGIGIGWNERGDVPPSALRTYGEVSVAFRLECSNDFSTIRLIFKGGALHFE